MSITLPPVLGGPGFSALSTGTEPSDYGNLPANLDADSFRSWPESYQRSYITANGTGTPPALLIGRLGSGSIHATAGTSVTIVDEPSDIARQPATMSQFTFNAWPDVYKAAYVESRQTGTPPSLLLGTLGLGSLIAAVTNGALTTTNEPTGAGTPPASLSADLFRTWPEAYQRAYVAKHDTTGAGRLLLGVLGSGSSLVDATATPPTVTAEPGNIGTAPDSLTRTAFEAWSEGFRVAYVTKHQTGTPPAVILGTPGSSSVLARLSGTSTLLVPEPPNFALEPQFISPTAFADWPAAYQDAYVDVRGFGTPKEVVIGTPGSGSIAATQAGNGISIIAEPPGVATAPASLSPATFSSWPTVYQENYLTRNGTGSPYTAVIGSGADMVVAQLNYPIGVSLTSGPAGFTLPPNLLTPAAFEGWAQAYRVAYFNSHATGEPKGLVVGTMGSGAKLYTLSLGTFTPTAEPIGSNLAPGSLTVSQFAGWNPLFQAAYIAAKGTGNPPYVMPGSGKTDAFSLGADGYTVTRVTRPTTYTEVSTPLVSAELFSTWPNPYAQEYHRVLATSGVLNLTGATGTLRLTRAADGSLAFNAPHFANESNLPIQATPGDGKDIPYFLLAGSSTGTPSPQLLADARDLFDVYNGTSVKMSANEPTPNQFTTNPTTLSGDQVEDFLEVFSGWHSAFQLEYINTWGTTENGTKVLSIPASNPLMTAVVSITNPEKFFIVQNIQKADIAKMSLADQTAIAATTAFRTQVSGRLGYQPTDSLTSFVREGGLSITQTTVNGSTVTVPNWTSDTWRAELKQFIADTIDEMDDRGMTYRAGVFPDDYVELFSDQLNNISTQLDGMAIFSQDDIRTRVAAIKDRFDRVFAFYDVQTTPSTQNYTIDVGENGTNVSFYRNVISRDNTATIQRGVEIFITQERKLRDLDNARMQMASTGQLLGKSMDAPSLIYFFQYHYNLSVEALVVIETEEVNQLNDLLKTYAAMQNIVAETQKKFDGNSEQKKRLFGLGVNDAYQISDADRRIISMFEDGLNGQPHPMERLRSITRPTTNMINNSTSGDRQADLEEFLKTVWDTVGSQLSETVTLLNQESQIKMNDINSLDKQKNRHFELANSALSKMFDMISSIARVG